MVESQRLSPSKFSPRPLGPSQLKRERLLALLERHAHAKLVLMHAPAGYGKTTLMIQWCEHLAAAGQGTGWVTLDDDDNDAGRLVTALSLALSPAARGAADLFDSINRCLQAHSRFTLFLDEEEHVSAADAQHLLDVLLDLSPANLHLVVGSRLQPQKIATRLRMRSDYLEMAVRDLAFSADEIARFLKLRCSMIPDAPTLQYLEHRTEGWAAVLQLAAAEIARGEPPRTAFAYLAAPHSNLFQYLSDEVMVHLQPQQCEFLLQTAFVDELSGPLCDAITGRTDSVAMLSDLAQANLLLQPLDPSRRSYRYHALFAEFLRQQLRERHADLLPTLARRASEWCVGAGKPESAVEYALLAADAEHLIACIGVCMEQLIARAQFATAKRWLRAIAPSVLKHRPELLIWSAWVEVYTNEFANAERAIPDLQRLIESRELSVKDRLGAAVLEALLFIHRGRFGDALNTAQAVWREAPPTEWRFIAALSNIRGLLQLMRGQFADATQDTERVLAIAGQSPPLWLSLVHAAHISGMTEMALGNLSGAWRQLTLPEQSLAASGERAECNPSQLLALLSGPKALVLYELNKLDDAEDCLERYEPFLNTMFSPSSRTLWHQLRTRLRALRGQEDECLSAIEEGAAYAARHGIAWMDEAMKWERIDHDLARGDINRVRAVATGLLQRVQLAALPEWIAPCEEVFGPIIGAIRLLIHLDEGRRALEYLPIHIAHSERQLRRLRLIKLRVLEALARHRLGERTEALHSLRQAIELGQQSAAIRIFVDEGPMCQELLRGLDRDGDLRADAAAYVRRLRGAFEDADDLDGGAAATDRAAVSLKPLSARETQILERLAEGHSNLAVGQQLFLSANTVKWHLSQIYSKLGVRNRTQAVHVARQHHLTRLS